MNEATEIVSDWINNDEGLYRLAQSCDSYQEFADIMGSELTPCGSVSYNSGLLDYAELDEVIADTNA